jgi:hypothetical protein
MAKSLVVSAVAVPPHKITLTPATNGQTKLRFVIGPLQTATYRQAAKE